MELKIGTYPRYAVRDGDIPKMGASPIKYQNGWPETQRRKEPTMDIYQRQSNFRVARSPEKNDGDAGCLYRLRNRLRKSGQRPREEWRRFWSYTKYKALSEKHGAQRRINATLGIYTHEAASECLARDPEQKGDDSGHI